MKTNSIGILDSGFGGLTAMRQIRALLPHENIIYLGDTARLPYGNKSADTILNYCLENIPFLIDRHIKVLVIACHTACTASLDHLKKIFPIPIIGIIEQSIHDVVQCTQTQKIAILGTRATISSGVYQNRIQQLLPSADLFAIACPLLVPLVEEGYIDHPATSLIIKEYLSSLKNKNIDTALLGCTHYPLLLPLIHQELGNAMTLIDPALGCAQQTRQFLFEKGLLNPQKTLPHYAFYVTDAPEKFKLIGETFLKFPIEYITQI